MPVVLGPLLLIGSLIFFIEAWCVRGNKDERGNFVFALLGGLLLLWIGGGFVLSGLVGGKP